jgi:hypothetical protein
MSHKKIIARVFGGIGNQLFIYAAARALAIKNSTPLFLDIISGFRGKNSERDYTLGHFNINAQVASKWESYDFCGGRGAQFIAKKVSKILPLEKKIYILQYAGYNPELADLKIKRKTYLEGYWQSEKYFTDIANIIREELTFKKKTAGLNKELAETIATCQAVSIHARRGDYVSNAKTRQIHGFCGLAYYHTCIKEIASRVANPHFFIFSDDSRWCKDNLRLQHPVTFIDHNGPDKCHEDLRLMSLCKHNIIANSSFSWWGAWLNRNENKIVIAPNKWFTKKIKGSEDIIPNNWIKK